MAMVAATCGDDSASPATTTTTSDSTTTTVAATTTTVDSRPLAALDGRPVEDPLYGTGFHEVAVDEPGTFAYSLVPITGDTPGANLLGIGMPFAVATTGLGDDLVALIAWVHEPTVDSEPTPAALVVYREGVDGWEIVVAFTDAAILGFLETTTDYMAWKPHDGTFYARTTVSTLDWDGSMARIVADVHVLDSPDNAEEFFAEVECTANGAMECVLLSDDGVLRPGDSGEAVEELQMALIEIGYMDGEPSGEYDDATAAAVSRLQRDFRLARDGRVGPNTQAAIDDILAGEIVLADEEGIGSVDFGTGANAAISAIEGLLGSADSATGWVTGPCGPGWDWNILTWGGFTAIFTERDGPRTFDGWRVEELADVPNFIFFAGGIAQNWRWSNFDSMGAEYDPFYGFWYHGTLGYGIGEFVGGAPDDPPPANAQILTFGTGTGAVLWDC